MLEFFRKMSQNVVFKVFLALLLLSFVLSGITGISSMSFTEDYLVKVGDEKITQYAVDKRYEEAVINTRRAGFDFSDEQLASMGLSKPQILRDMVQDSLLRQEVKDLGIEIGDEVIAEQIQSTPEFQTNGKFDREKFTYFLNSKNLREKKLVNIMKEEIKNNLLLLTISANTPRNEFVEKEHNARYGEKRDVEIAIIPKTLNVEVAEPNDEQLKEYYDQHSYEFQVPETRDISYIILKKTKENEATLYDTTIKIEDELAGGATLKEISEKMKFDLKTKSAVKADDEELPDLLLETAFDKSEGDTSDLVLNEQDGEYYVIEVNSITKARIPELAEIKEKVVAGWKAESANDANLKYIEEQAEELKNSNESLQAFASKNGYRYELLQNVRRADTEAHGARLIDGAFAAETGDIIGSFQNEDGTYKIAKLKAIRPGTLNFEEQVQIKGALDNALKVELMDQYFEGLRKKFTVKQKEKIAKATPDDQSVPVPPKVN